MKQENKEGLKILALYIMWFGGLPLLLGEPLVAFIMGVGIPFLIGSVFLIEKAAQRGKDYYNPMV